MARSLHLPHHHRKSLTRQEALNRLQVRRSIQHFHASRQYQLSHQISRLHLRSLLYLHSQASAQVLVTDHLTLHRYHWFLLRHKCLLINRLYPLSPLPLQVIAPLQLRLHQASQLFHFIQLYLLHHQTLLPYPYHLQYLYCQAMFRVYQMRHPRYQR